MADYDIRPLQLRILKILLAVEHVFWRSLKEDVASC